ncbi:MAG: hypothetical protein COY66_02475 [Candidatus Kerfeldbacteria bacterium CG_4_10_14_0_8_um_filter_42_10]|uniref:Polymerase/histidinol phosphatase N-terminal domain-containing protein n=1 Tax=Candidatus Kerfeldbacteria bacterium CG_4_10_14_0_8_um_filter_42_10 TaxID=2014248 RepID=A0A2M7RJX0_9BACT|nr:MAG: hypothetical protein COY66_02475 [Candidatus Kerfeldbacteria bacterium CG_4_10_14_0_8_um_filter_42_10]
MEKYIDLHIHSVYSEGALSCAEILKLADRNNIKVLALTDHNVIDGVPEITKLSRRYKIKVLPGVEIYTHYQGRALHLLGYNFRLGDTELSRALKELQKNHINKVKRSIADLKRRGFVINEEKIFQNPSKQLGAIHILAEIEKYPENKCKIRKEIPSLYNDYLGKIHHYLGKGRAGYFELSQLPLLKAIQLIKKAGGQAVLAHPGQQLIFKEDKVIPALVKGGLDGLEVLSPYHNWHQIEHYLKMAVQYRLLITGGSDFHEYVKIKGQAIINKQWDYYKIPYRLYRDWQKMINN